MKAARRNRVDPVWLAPMWEARKKETAVRVQAAIDRLREANRQVTLSAIRESVRDLFDRSISANTIKRNEVAYQLYLENRHTPRMSLLRSQSVLEFYDDTEPGARAAAQARVARMRRRTKDDLIVRLLRAEEMLTASRNVEDRLREEIIRLHVIHGPKTI
jgi:multidrug efflux pump subunit AcrB